MKLKKISLKSVIFLLSMSTISINTHALEIYQYINWRYYKDSNKSVTLTKDNSQFQDFLGTKNIKKMDVIYPLYLLTNNKPDPSKIKKIAEQSKKDPTTPICFDIEIGSPFVPSSNLPVIIESLKLYHKFGGAAPVGVYGVLPQKTPNIFLTNALKSKYTKLNSEYAELAKYVDFLSPTLYLYELKDMNIWKQKASFNFAEANRYAKKYNLEIIPFVSLSNWKMIRDKNITMIDPLSEKQMTEKLDYLDSLGAKGVVLWEPGASRQDHEKKAAIFDVERDSFKAVVRYANRK